MALSTCSAAALLFRCRRTSLSTLFVAKWSHSIMVLMDLVFRHSLQLDTIPFLMVV